MKKIIITFIALVSILGCKKDPYENWKKTEDGNYQKTIFPYRYDWTRINTVPTLKDTLNGTFEVYNKNGTLNHKGEFKDGKIYGNLYEYDASENLKEYSFIWEHCENCGDLPSAHYILEYDSIWKQKDYFGKAIIDWSVKQSEIKLTDSLEINVLLATPPHFNKELVIVDLNTKKELKVIPNPENNNSIKIGFNSTGKKRLGIHYRLIQEDSPSGMISTADIENIIVTE